MGMLYTFRRKIAVVCIKTLICIPYMYTLEYDLSEKIEIEQSAAMTILDFLSITRTYVSKNYST